MTHRIFARTAGILAAGGLVVAAVAAPGAALASQPTGHTVTICHATNSDTNPYVRITVDVASAGHLHGGHDTQHTGPVWDATLKASHVSWGDIIPAYSFDGFSYPGQNLDLGLATWLNGCVVPAADARVDETPSSTPDAASPSGSPEGEVLPTDEVLPAPAVPADAQPSNPATSDAAPSNAAPGEGTATPDPAASATPTEGAVEIDGPFVTSTPSGTVAGATGYPDITPPSTDILRTAAASTPGAGLQLLLLAVTGLSIVVLVAGRLPAARRR